MAISPISTNSLNNGGFVNPYAKSEQLAAIPQLNQDAQKSPQAAKTDTVTISPQALKMANNENGAQESGESKNKQQYEALSGKQ